MRGWIVDDDPIFQMAAEQAFRQVSGWDRVETFLRARNALDDLQYRQRTEAFALPDAILLDLNMPVMDGWAFIEEWERESHMCPKDIRIIIVSANLNSNDRERIKGKRSVLAALDKPIRPSELRDLLDTGFKKDKYAGLKAPHLFHKSNSGSTHGGPFGFY